MAGQRAAAGLAVAALALTAAGCGLGGGTKTVTTTRVRTVTTTRTITRAAGGSTSPCTGSQLTGTFAVVAGSAGAGQVSYLLALKNASQTSCYVAGFPMVGLLGANGAHLPTLVPSIKGTTIRKVALSPGMTAKAEARFSPDVPGTGDAQNGPCQPKAYTLQVTPDGGGTVMAPIQPPTSVCEQGTLNFEPYS